MTKTQYLLKSIRHFGSSKVCPYCGSGRVKVVDRKYLVTTLNECTDCSLLFRHPPDSTEFNYEFYQEGYEQHDGITTDLPSPSDLEQLMATNFKGSGKEADEKIEQFKLLTKGKPVKIIDYGANWGYTSFQFREAGFEVQSYEISKPRARFGTKLGLAIQTNEANLTGGVDIFFSAHVIEHVPDIRHMFRLAQSLLHDNGYFIAYCPNGSIDFKKKHPEQFHRFWGQVHPNFLSADFYVKAFDTVPYLLGSDAATTEDIQQWDGSTQQVLDLTGSELFAFAKIKSQGF